MQKMNKFYLAIGLAGAALSLSACKPSDSASTDPRTEPQLVKLAEVQAVAPSGRGFTGSVAARVQSNLTFRVAGKVTERLVDAGQTVRPGQPLMRIDRTDYGHAVSGQLGNVEAAKARLTQAAADEARYKGLVESGAVSKSAYDQAKAAADSARALLTAAEAQLKVAQDDGAYATLVADAGGVVMDTMAEPGQFVAAGQVVMRLAHEGPREAIVNLPETLRPAIGSTAEASLFGVKDRFPARLRQLSDTADPVTRTFEARYVLDGKAATAPLGATVTVLLPDAEPAVGVAVPLGAVDDEGKGPGIWTFDEQSSTVSFHPVNLVRLESERAILNGPLHQGERIVALGGHFLHEGQNVRIAEAQAGAK